LYTGYPWVFFSHALSNEPETILVLQRTSGFSLNATFYVWVEAEQVGSG
jgi:hypothetical protein